MLAPIKNSFKNTVKPIIAAGMALSMAFAPSAMAGKDFFKKDLTHETTRIVQLLGQRLSHDKLTFVVHGGEKRHQMAAYRAAQRLDDDGIPIAFLLAPNRYGIPGIVSIQYYTDGGTQYNSFAGQNINNDAEFEQAIYEHAKKAYDNAPSRVLATFSPE